MQSKVLDMKHLHSLLHSKTIKALRKMPDSLQLTMILIVLTALAALFYGPINIKEVSTANVYNEATAGNSDSSAGSSNDGIGGGSIIGNSFAGKKNLPIYCVDTKSSDGTKYASISFDAAWGADDTIQILDILDKYNVKATFFMTGGWVSQYPDMVKEIYKRGHDLGNHSENHKQMSKLSVSQQKDEIQKVTDKVNELTGYHMFLFRPPYGDYNSTLITTVYSCNYYPIQWSVDSLDWKDYGVSKIISTVTQHKALTNGAIILMHNGAKYTADALEQVITGLQSQGYTLIPISQLIIKENFHMDTTGKQIAD
jgi:polysaccharide deacetylase family sporulation protein PdaB